MTETILDVLDKQAATSLSPQQQTKGLSSNDNQTKVIESEEPKASPQKEDYPDLFLPIMENYRISDHVFMVIWTVCPQITTLWFW